MALWATLVSSVVMATGFTFGLLAKSIDDSNFVDTWRGCSDAARQTGDECVLLGGRGAAHPRVQVRALQEALSSGNFDALAISVVNSQLVARTLVSARIPIITFDSPFDAENADMSQTYVGIDNVDFGRALAGVAKELRPTGGSICLMSAVHDPNLMLRVEGVRQALSGDPMFPPNQRLKGEGGWIEADRCPWNSADSIERTMSQLAMTFGVIKPDVFLSVGHWPVIDAAAYRSTVEPFRDELVERKRIVIAAVGKVSPDMQGLMNDQLVHGYVSIDFYETGRLTYRAMKQLVEGKTVPSTVIIPNTVQIVR